MKDTDEKHPYIRDMYESEHFGNSLVLIMGCLAYPVVLWHEMPVLLIAWCFGGFFFSTYMYNSFLGYIGYLILWYLIWTVFVFIQVKIREYKLR
jgi:hypothetical protein